MNIIDTKYATTRMLISDKPEIVDVNNAKFSNQLFWIDNKIDFIESGLRTQGYFKKSTDQKPLITIITIVFNDEKFIEQTILSILTQTYANVEYIIIDGGSTDKTVDILKKYNDQIDYWISGKDNGIYDAMNRGIQLAQGEMIGLINSGDYCDQNALESFAAACSSKIACYYTDNFIVFDSMKMVTRKKASFNYRRGMPICHQSLFIAMKTYREIGLYSLKYRLLSDYDFFLKILKDKNYIFKYVPEAKVFAREGRSNSALMYKMAAESINVAWQKLSTNDFLFFFFYWCGDMFRGIVRTFLYKYAGNTITNHIRRFYQKLLFKRD